MPKLLTEQGDLNAACIPILQAEAEHIALAHYGKEGRFTRFATEKDDTFRIVTAEGEKFVLKVANPAEELQEISFQIGILKHIFESDHSLPVPRVIQNLRGEEQFSITDNAGQTRQVRMMTYLDGVPLVETVSNSIERIQIGEVLGRLRLATADFSHPADRRVLAWDVQHLLKLEHLLCEIKDDDLNKKLATAMARFARLSDQMSSCRTQVLHNDFSQSNIVVDHHLDSFVTGIIDFGDAVRTSVAIDVSTALLNQLPRTAKDDMFCNGRDVLLGYLSVVDLTESEMLLIPHLVMGRIVGRALLSIWRARLFPDNATYILRNTDQGWHQLDWFLSRSVDEVSAELIKSFPIPSLKG